MGAIADGFAYAFRDFVTDGVASSGLYEPEKSLQRALGRTIETAMSNIALSGIVNVAKEDKATLDADLAHAENSVGLVWNDPTTANNDLYIKSGASGAGAWSNLGIINTLIEVLADQYVVDAETAAGAAEAALEQVLAGIGVFVQDVPTDAFMRVETDEEGYAFAIQGNDGIWRSQNQDYLLGLIANGSEYVETDAYVVAFTDEEGYAWDVLRLVDGVPRLLSQSASTAVEFDPLLAVPAGNALAAFVYGQSVFTGADTVAVSTTPFAGLKMFNGGIRGFDHTNPANFTSFVNAVESGIESATRAAGESILQFYEDESGEPLTDNGVFLVLYNAAEGGKSAAELSSGGSYFPRLTAALTGLASTAAAGGNIPDTLYLIYCQGEADINLGTHPTTWYQTIETGIRAPLEAHAQSVLKRPTRVKIVMTQVASHQYYGFSDPAIAREALAICNRDENYIFAGPMYQFDYGAAGVGSHLLNATEVRWAAAIAGRPVQRGARGVEHRWINPLRAWQIGLRTVVVEYDVPVGPLVIDTVSVSDPGQKGFKLFSDTTEVIISSVAVFGVGGRCVRLTANSDIPAGVVRVDYAHAGGATGSPAGRSTGSRGNLRDSDPAVFDPSGTNKPLYNWAPIHRIYVG